MDYFDPVTLDRLLLTAVSADLLQCRVYFSVCFGDFCLCTPTSPLCFGDLCLCTLILITPSGMTRH